MLTIGAGLHSIVPVLTFRGNLTSAHISALLSYGFELLMDTRYDRHPTALDVNNCAGCTVTLQGLVPLHIDGVAMFSQQLHPAGAVSK